MEKRYDILVAGEINPDLILSSPDLEPRFGQHELLVEDAHLTIGSSSAIFACGAARLGLRTAIIGVIGKDLFGDFMLSEMQQRGVDTSPVIIAPQRPTGMSVILSRGQDRAILTHMGAIDALQAEQVRVELLDQACHLHVASYFLQTALQAGLTDLFRQARARGLTTSLDTNWDPAGKWSGVIELLKWTDVFLPNAAEAQAITGLLDIEDAARELSHHAGNVAIKLGAQGSLAVADGSLVYASSLPVKVADTVGAGDSFDAGYLYGYLNRWPVERCLKLATVCGAISTQAAGGTTGQATLREALSYVN